MIFTANNLCKEVREKSQEINSREPGEAEQDLTFIYLFERICVDEINIPNKKGADIPGYISTFHFRDISFLALNDGLCHLFYRRHDDRPVLIFAGPGDYWLPGGDH